MKIIDHYNDKCEFSDLSKGGGAAGTSDTGPGGQDLVENS